jgi:nucleoside-diphosphate-sugar epimerase
MRGRVAIIGAGGFVGARLLEMAVLGGRTDIVPVVRSFKSVARVANLGISHRLADASRPDSLAPALAGCEVVVNLTSGEPADILPTTQSIHAAAVAAGARLLVHLSSATVYGPVERPELPDDAPPLADHWMPYAREKGRAENFLREHMAGGPLAIVVLRPGLIWGPGSPWVLGPAAGLLGGSAYLIGDGQGLCNLVYVDNLVRSIDAVVAHPAPAPGFYNVADDEMTTWREYYSALAAGLGIDTATVHRVAADRYRAGFGSVVDELKKLPPYQWLKNGLPPQVKAAIKLRIRRVLERDGPAQGNASAAPAVDRAMWDLQTTRYRLPTARFVTTFGRHNLDTLASGVAASLAWLRFIGHDGRDAVPHPVSSTAGSAQLAGRERNHAGIPAMPAATRPAASPAAIRGGDTPLRRRS